ncbi:MAG: polymer-forming cytoskeletal protein [Leptospirales bacterium]
MFKNNNLLWYYKISLAFLITAFMAFGYPLYASEIKTGKNVTIDEMLGEDLYAASDNVTVISIIQGDANLVGKVITVTSGVSGDLNIIGSEVKIVSNVGDDIHLLGKTGSITGTIDGDVFVAAGDLVIEKNSLIKGDLYIAGGDIKIYGKINGSVFIVGGDVVLAGETGKELKLQAGNTTIIGSIHGKATIGSNQLKIDPQARFYSDVEYWSENDVDFGKSVIAGEARYSAELEQTFKPPYKFIIIFILLWLASSAFTIYLLNRIFGTFFKESSVYLKEKFLASFGTGILYFIVFPILIVILAITVVAFPFAVVFAFVYTLTFMFARPISAIMATYWLQNRLGKEWSRKRIFITGYGIYLGIVFIRFIPIIGWLAEAVFISACIGSGIHVMRRKKM